MKWADRVRGVVRGTYGLRLLLEPNVQLVAGALFLGIVLAYRLAQFAVFTTQDQWGYDFSAYWLAGRHVLEGTWLYHPQQLAGPYPPQQQYLYLYPPLLAVIVAPLGALFDDYRGAAWVWSGLGAAIVVAAVIVLARAEGIDRRRDLGFLLAAAFALPPLVAELVLGNVHVLLLGLVAAAWWGIRRANKTGDVLAGAAVGAAAMIKIFPGLIVVWFFLTGRYRAAAIAVVAAGGLVLCTLPVVGLGPWLDYPRVLLNLAAPPNEADALAPTVCLSDLAGFTAARVGVTALGLLLVIWSARAQTAAVSFAVTVMVSLLIAPALYHTYLSLTVAPFILALAHTRARVGLLVAYLGMFAGEQPALGDLAWVLSRGIPTAGALLLLLLLLREGRRDRQDSLSKPPAQLAAASIWPQRG